VLTDHLSELLFCPTETAVENLRREGFTHIVNEGKPLPLEEVVPIPKGNPHHGPLVLNVGDVMYDAALMYLELAEGRSTILDQLDLQPKNYALATVHRAENTDDPNRLKRIFQGLAKLAQEGLKVVLPLHPRTRKALAWLSLKEELDGLLLIDPVSYLDMLILEKNARVILTDSGGVQKEAFFFKVSCVTLREETEWVETVETGWNVLMGSDPARIYQAALEARPGVESAWSYGDGRAAERIVLYGLCILGKQDAHLS